MQIYAIAIVDVDGLVDDEIINELSILDFDYFSRTHLATIEYELDYEEECDDDMELVILTMLEDTFDPYRLPFKLVDWKVVTAND